MTGTTVEKPQVDWAKAPLVLVDWRREVPWVWLAVVLLLAAVTGYGFGQGLG